MRYFERFLIYCGLIIGLALFLLLIWYVAIPLLIIMIILGGARILKGRFAENNLKYSKNPPLKNHPKVIDVEFTEVKKSR